MDKAAVYVQTIAEAHPDLPIWTARLHNDEGQYNDILIVNEEIIFRFPRYPDGVATISREVDILSHIQDYVTLSVPNPVYKSRKRAAVGKVFMGYRMIPGRPLWRQTLENIDGKTIAELAAQLATFLEQLHAIPLELLGPDVPGRDGAEEWAAMFEEIRQQLFSFMRPDARHWTVHHFETFLDSPHLHAYRPALRHGDFGASNILYDQEVRTISGIIDFGFAAIGDPALDIAAVATFGESFFNLFCDHYPGIETMLARARFYKGTYALSEALHGIKHGDAAAFESGIANYR